MQIKELIIGIPILMFVLWIFMAPIPKERIERACAPISWVGNLATSTTALATKDNTATADRWSDNLNYSCQYLVWRLFYQADYNKAIEQGLIVPGPAQASPNTAPSSAAESTAEPVNGI